MRKRMTAFKVIFIMVTIVMIVGITYYFIFGDNYSKTIVIDNEILNNNDKKTVYGAIDIDVEPGSEKSLEVIREGKLKGVDSLNNQFNVFGYLEKNKILCGNFLNSSIETNQQKNLFLLDLDTGEKEIILDKYEGQADISPDGTKLISDISKDGCYIFDLNTKEKKYINNNVPGGAWSKDSRYYVFGHTLNNQVNIYDIKNRKDIKLKYKNKRISIIYMIGIEGNMVYFEGIEKGKDYSRIGVYKSDINKINDVSTVFTFPYYQNEKTSEALTKYMLLVNYIVNDGKGVIFAGIVNGENGIYLFDSLSNKLYKVSSSTDLYISPDRKRVIYSRIKKDERYNEEKSFCVATIEQDKLADSLLIDSNKHTNYQFFWCTNSKEILKINNLGTVTTLK